MTAHTPEQLRALAEGVISANNENHRMGQRVPAVADRAAAALRAAAAAHTVDDADQLEAVRALPTWHHPDGDIAEDFIYVHDLLAILTADTAPQEDHDD